MHDFVFKEIKQIDIDLSISCIYELKTQKLVLGMNVYGEIGVCDDHCFENRGRQVICDSLIINYLSPRQRLFVFCYQQELNMNKKKTAAEIADLESIAQTHYSRANRLSDELNYLQAEHLELKRQVSKWESN